MLRVSSFTVGIENPQLKKKKKRGKKFQQKKS